MSNGPPIAVDRGRAFGLFNEPTPTMDDWAFGRRGQVTVRGRQTVDRVRSVAG
jgi:hypothetical protein